MNKLFISIVLVFIAPVISLAASSKLLETNSNPQITSVDNKTVYYDAPLCFKENARTEVRLLLLDTNYPNETVIKEHVWFEDLTPGKSYFYTFDNDASKYTIMVNGLCKISDYKYRLRREF